MKTIAKNLGFLAVVLGAAVIPFAIKQASVQAAAPAVNLTLIQAVPSSEPASNGQYKVKLATSQPSGIGAPNKVVLNCGNGGADVSLTAGTWNMDCTYAAPASYTATLKMYFPGYSDPAQKTLAIVAPSLSLGTQANDARSSGPFYQLTFVAIDSSAIQNKKMFCDNGEAAYTWGHGSSIICKYAAAGTYRPYALIYWNNAIQRVGLEFPIYDQKLIVTDLNGNQVTSTTGSFQPTLGLDQYGRSGGGDAIGYKFRCYAEPAPGFPRWDDNGTNPRYRVGDCVYAAPTTIDYVDYLPMVELTYGNGAVGYRWGGIRGNGTGPVVRVYRDLSATVTASNYNPAPGQTVTYTVTAVGSDPNKSVRFFYRCNQNVNYSDSGPLNGTSTFSYNCTYDNTTAGAQQQQASAYVYRDNAATQPVSTTVTVGTYGNLSLNATATQPAGVGPSSSSVVTVNIPSGGDANRTFLYTIYCDKNNASSPYFQQATTARSLSVTCNYTNATQTAYTAVPYARVDHLSYPAAFVDANAISVPGTPPPPPPPPAALNVSLTASSLAGNNPYTTTLTATVNSGGDATKTFLYTFNCDDGKGPISLPATTARSATYNCAYTNTSYDPITRTPTVKVEHISPAYTVTVPLNPPLTIPGKARPEQIKIDLTVGTPTQVNDITYASTVKATVLPGGGDPEQSFRYLIDCGAGAIVQTLDSGHSTSRSFPEEGKDAISCSWINDTDEPVSKTITLTVQHSDYEVKTEKTVEVPKRNKPEAPNPLGVVLEAAPVSQNGTTYSSVITANVNGGTDNETFLYIFDCGEGGTLAPPGNEITSEHRSQQVTCSWQGKLNEKQEKKVSVIVKNSTLTPAQAEKTIEIPAYQTPPTDNPPTDNPGGGNGNPGNVPNYGEGSRAW